MLPSFNKNSSTTFHSILELYQQCRRNGDWARIYLETQDGREFFTVSICPLAGKPAGVAEEEKKKPKKKKPSQVRRDQLRRAAFLERRQRQASEADSVTTNKFRDEEENKAEDMETGKSVTGETRSAELGDGKKSSDEEKIGSDEERMTNEATKLDIEKLEELIRNAVNTGVNRGYEESLEKLKNRLNEEDYKNSEDDNDNENSEEAKMWALKQKRSYINK